MIHVGDRGIYSSICADAARRFAGEKCGQNVMKKWSLGKKAVTIKGGVYLEKNSGVYILQFAPMQLSALLGKNVVKM